MSDLYLDIDAVLLRMQINGDLDGVRDAIASAITGAQLHVESILDSGLSVRSWDCVFHLDGEAYSGIQVGGVFKLVLPSGFVRTAPVPVVTVDDTSWGMGGEATADAQYYRWDRVRGFLYVDAAQFKGKYVRIRCDTGFEAGDLLSDPVVPADVLPEWLTEAILAFVPITFDSSQTTNRNAEATSQYKVLATHAETMLARYNRNTGFAARPIVTS